MLNFVGIQGRFVRDPEMRRTNSGKAVVSFTLAVDRPGKDNGAAFIPCVAWEKTAEFINNYFTKGNAIVVEGRLDSRDWNDKDGNKRTAYEVVVNQAHFCEKKEKAEAVVTNFTPPSPPAGGFGMLIDDDPQLPF
jgi:single-strand DNA-binding protein